MTQTVSAAARNTLAVRPANSRKLLARKAAEQAPAANKPSGEALEDSFPAADAVIAEATHEAPPAATDPAPIVALADIGASIPASPAPEPAGDQPSIPAPELEGAPPTPPAAAPAPLSASAPAWSREDEAALQAMLARRKAAGPRRGKDVGGMLLRLGTVAPNPGTVVATIVGLVAAAGGAVLRDDLLALMARATFANARAKPGDKGWCQGYVAGAIRDGFLAVSAPARGEVAVEVAA